MTRRSLLAATAGIPAARCQSDITAFGASANDGTNSRKAIQRAIDECAVRGGGIVRIPAGRFVSGTLRLKTGVALWLDHGAVLSAIREPAEYENRRPTDRLPPNSWECAFILVEGAERVAVLGNGTIRGAGLSKRREPGKPLEPFRPRLLSFEHCRDVRVEGVSLVDADRWTLHFYDCDSVQCHDLRIHADYGIVNTDGIDIDGSRNVVISGCEIVTGDDCVVLKTTNYLGAPRPCENVTVTNCTLSTRASALKVGTETHGDIGNLAFSNCSVFGVGNTRPDGVCLEAVDGARLRGVSVANITMRNVRAPLFIRAGSRAAPSSVEDVVISNIIAVDASMASSITGIPGRAVRNISCSDMRLVMAGGGETGIAERAVPEKESAYPSGGMFGKLPAHGFYVRHARGVTLRNIDISTDGVDDRPALIADDVADLSIEGLRTPSPLRLKNVRGSVLRGSRMPVHISGAQSKDVVIVDDQSLDGADLARIDADVPAESVKVRR